MAIYRGPGGPGDAVEDASSEVLLAIQAKDAAIAAQTAAEIAETNAEAAATLAASYTPSQTGNAGKYLQTNGTTTSWQVVDAFPTQTGNAGKYLQTDGTTTSWQTGTALPSQTGNNGKYLTTNGTTSSWNNFAINTAAYSSVAVAADDVTLIYDTSGTTTAKCLTSDIAGLGLGSIGYRTNYYYFPFGVHGPNNSGTTTVNRLYYYPFFVRKKTTFTRIGIQIPSGSSNLGTSARLGIYTAVDGLPSSLLLDAGTVSTATTGEKEATISQELNTGFYFLAFVSDSLIGIQTHSTTLSFAVGQESRTAPVYGYYRENGSITFPTSETTTGLLTITTVSPAVTLRVV